MSVTVELWESKGQGVLGSRLASILWKPPLKPPWLKRFSSRVNCVDHTASLPWKDDMEPTGSPISQSLRAPGRDKRLRNILLGTVNGRLRLWSSAVSATIYSLGDLDEIT